MNFKILFKTPQGTQSYLKEVETHLYVNQEKTPENLLKFTPFGEGCLTIHDKEREKHLVQSIELLIATKEIKDKHFLFIFKYDSERSLDLFKIWNLIESSFNIKKSAPLLLQAFNSKNLDLFFKNIIDHKYEFQRDSNFKYHIFNEKSL